MLKSLSFWSGTEQFLFYALIFILPFSTGLVLASFSSVTEVSYTQAIIYLSDFILVGLLIFWLGRTFIRHKGRRGAAFLAFLRNFLRLDWAYLLLPAFFVLSFIAVLRAEVLGAAFYQLVKLLEFILLFFYLKNNFGRFSSQFTARVFITASLIQAALIYLQYGREDLILERFSSVEGLFLAPTNFLRAAGTFEHPFLLASFVGVAAFLVYFLVLQRRFFFDLPNPEFLSTVREDITVRDSFRRIGLIIAFFVLVLAMALTFSRSVILIFLVGFILFNLSLYLSKKTKPIFGLRVVYLMAIFLVVLILITFLLWPEFSSRFAFGEILASPRNIIFDQMTVDILRNNPRFGIGPGNYVLHLANVRPDLPLIQIQPVNNLYWLIGAEAGLAALIIIFVFFVWVLFKLWRVGLSQDDARRKSVTWLLFWTLVFVLASAFFGHFFWTTQSGRLIFWLFLGISAYYISHQRPVSSDQ